MFKGDELVGKRNLLLFYLYQQGAIAFDSALDAFVLQEAIKIDNQDFKPLCDLLSQAGLVKVYDVWSGTGEKITYRKFSLWLTAAGLEEAHKIAQAVSNAEESASKPPMGFPRPSKD